MVKRTKQKRELRGKARVRAEVVETARALHKVGAVSDTELEKTTPPAWQDRLVVVGTRKRAFF
jgi:hypothetical protein